MSGNMRMGGERGIRKDYNELYKVDSVWISKTENPRYIIMRKLMDKLKMDWGI